MQVLNLSAIVLGLMLTPLFAQNTNSSQDDSRASSANRTADQAGDRDSMTVPAGAEIVVRTNEVIDSTSSKEGQSFSGTVQENVAGANGETLIPKGSEARLVVRRAATGGTTGSAQLALGLDSVDIRGHRYAVDSSDVERGNDRGIGKNRRTGEYVGGGAVLGTLVGAMAGGGKGAAIGAIAGAAAGGTAQVLTKGKEVKVPAETTLRFRLDQPLGLRATDR